jgi:hypothetical protein
MTRFSETWVHIRTIQSYIKADGTCHNYSCENHQSYVLFYYNKSLLIRPLCFSVTTHTSIFHCRNFHLNRPFGGRIVFLCSDKNSIVLGSINRVTASLWGITNRPLYRSSRKLIMPPLATLVKPFKHSSFEWYYCFIRYHIRVLL